VTPGRVCDTFREELRSSLTSRPKCSPVEASAAVVTTGAQRGAVPHLSTTFVQPSEQLVNHESSVWSEDPVGLQSTPRSEVVPGDGIVSSTRSTGALMGDDRWSMVNEEDGGTRTSAADGQVQSS